MLLLFRFFKFHVVANASQKGLYIVEILALHSLSIYTEQVRTGLCNSHYQPPNPIF